MRTSDSQLTRKQKFGVVLLLICAWAFLFGIYWTIFQNTFDGIIIAGASAIGSAVVYTWLAYIHPDNS